MTLAPSLKVLYDLTTNSPNQKSPHLLKMRCSNSGSILSNVVQIRGQSWATLLKFRVNLEQHFSHSGSILTKVAQVRGQSWAKLLKFGVNLEQCWKLQGSSMRNPQVSIKSQALLMAKKLRKIAKNYHFKEVGWFLVWWLCSEVIYNSQGSLKSHPWETPRFLSSPKLE